MQRSDLLALLMALALTGVLVGGFVYLMSVWWDQLPKGVALAVCVLLAMMVIGYPIYALARWSNRYLARLSTASPPSSSKGDA